MSFCLVVPVHLHHDRRLRAGPLAHRLVFQLDALDLDALDEFHEGVGADDADLFLHRPRPGTSAAGHGRAFAPGESCWLDVKGRRPTIATTF